MWPVEASRCTNASGGIKHSVGYTSPMDALENGPREMLVYVTCINAAWSSNQKPDFLATIDLDPSSSTYSQIIHKTEVVNAGDELHHMGWNACSSCRDCTISRSHLVVPGLNSDRIYIIDIETTPRAPKIKKVIESSELHEANASAPHTVHCLPTGDILISCMGDAKGNAKGTFLVLEQKSFNIKGTWQLESDSVEFNYDYWYQLRHNVMISTEWAAPKTFRMGFDIKDVQNGQYGHSINVWDWTARKRIQRLNLGRNGQIPLEVRFLHNPYSTEGFVGCALSSTIIRFYKTEDNSWASEVVLTVSPKKVKNWTLTDMPGFVKGQSDNLPKIDALCMFAFLRKNPDFTGAEIRGIKTKRSGRESYGDNAVGYVQVKRDSNMCTVKATITPEHRISKKGYLVTVICNEEEEEVLSAQCDSCAASLGGCKHAIAFLAWLHRRSEEPAVTEVTSYWKKSKLSAVGTSVKFIKAKNLGKNPARQISPETGSFLSAVLAISQKIGRRDSVLTKYDNEFTTEEKLSIHHLMLGYLETQDSESSADGFLEYCKYNMSVAACGEAAIKTVEQSESTVWHELRYGRITASRAHESSNCQTMNGSLVESIFGSSSIKDTYAMKRGKFLENEVRQLVGKKVGMNIRLCGFYTMPDYPIMGASPDGITDDCVIEIKCPSSEKAMKNYVIQGEIAQKYKAQIQMQMYFTKKQKGLFCVADFDFENTKKVMILESNFDPQYCEYIIEKCTKFWKLAIFPILQNKKK